MKGVRLAASSLWSAAREPSRSAFFNIFVNDVLDLPPYICMLMTQRIIAGLPRARSARGAEPHTHGIWSTSFRLLVT